MAQIEDAALEYQLKRWMRHDAHRYIRPDWRRFVRPGYINEWAYRRCIAACLGK